MRRTKYRGYHKKSAEVVYDITNGVCVFSGITPSDVVSTIQGAEKVIAAICLDAKIHPKDLMFYDLQTHLGYGLFKPGVCDFSKLEVVIHDAPKDIFWRFLERGEEKYVLSVESWSEADCPDEIMQKFSRYSGCTKFNRNEQRELKIIGASITNIFTAADEGWDATVKKYLDTGTPINGKEADGCTALHAASRAGRLSTADLLVKHGANINETNNYNKTPYDVALQILDKDTREQMLQFFKSHGADTNSEMRAKYYNKHSYEFTETPW